MIFKHVLILCQENDKLGKHCLPNNDSPWGRTCFFDLKHQSKRLLMTPSVYSVSAAKSIYGR